MSRPKTTKVTRLDYCQYLFSSQTNYTLTNFSEHVADLSHDMINRYLRDEHLTASLVWEHTQPTICQNENGFLVFDDSILDKNHSRKIESVRWQYSGNAHGIVRGIGLVSCIYINPKTKQFWLIDYRIFDPERDGKSKVDHVQDMLKNAIYSKQLSFKTVLVDTWYASNKLMLYIHDLGKYFYCPIKRNRLVRHAGTSEYYQSVTALPWSEEELKWGKQIRLKAMPRDFYMKLFRVPVSTNRTDYVATNDTSQHCRDDTQQVCAIRWFIEQFHREIKQLTGIERCECRKQRIQRNHIACALLVWVKMKDFAYQSQQTVYQIKKNLLRNYLIQELKNPSIFMGFA
jgi:hypothetical protein